MRLQQKIVKKMQHHFFPYTRMPAGAYCTKTHDPISINKSYILGPKPLYYKAFRAITPYIPGVFFLARIALSLLIS